VTYATRGASGSIDILAWHPSSGAILVIEVKTEIASAEAVLRKLDEKVRLAAAVAAERFGWRVTSVSQLLVIEESSTNRRRLAAHAALFDAALPSRGRDMQRWLADLPSVSVGGCFWHSALSVLVSNGEAVDIGCGGSSGRQFVPA
jgi:hypothetical protein